ncbi:MAG: aminotransferase, partial [Ensifer adhaerens]
WNRDRLVAEINGRGVPCFSGSCSEIYREQTFVNVGMVPAHRLPVARSLGETSLAFLVDPSFDEQAMRTIADVVRNVVVGATK